MRRAAHSFLLSLVIACGNANEIVVGRVHVQPALDAALPAPPSPTQIPTILDGSTSLLDASDNSLRPADAQSGPMPTEPDPAGAADANVSTPEPDPCAPSGLLHEYAFSGSGSQVVDSAGDSNAELVGGAMLSSTQGTDLLGAELDGDDDYVQLPTGMLAGLQSVTLNLWFDVDGGPGYVRMLDFGIGSTGEAVEGDGSVGRSYLAITPATGLERTGLAALATADGAGGEVAIDTELEVRDGEMHQVTVVIDGEQSTMRLYLDGSNAGEASLPFELSEITDQNNWLGRSQYDADPYFEGHLYRFEVFGAALSDCQVTSLWQRGPS